MPESLILLKNQGIDSNKITVSSDANGSVPQGNSTDFGVGRPDQLLNDIRACILGEKLDFVSVLKTVTANPARVLKIYPQKGALMLGSDADIMVLKKDDLSIFRLLAKGQVVVKNQIAVKKGRYEN